MAGSLADLTRRYRRLSKLYHPDLQLPENRLLFERRMQLINEAYTEALKRFNIYTYRNPKQDPASPTIHEDLFRDPPPAYQRQRAYEPHKTGWTHAQPRPQARPAPPPKPPSQNSFNALAAGNLGAALAVLKRTRTFFSMHATDDAQERAQYVQAMELLQGVLDRFPGTVEAQDALYYMAVASCNLKEYPAAISLFSMYRKRYPQDARSGLFYFYSGLCHHRLGNFPQAVEEYGWFLMSQTGAQYRHFTALVASYKEAAEKQVVPLALPYG
jgi:tetratricopeptide (TPR) repeat protein